MWPLQTIIQLNDMYHIYLRIQKCLQGYFTFVLMTDVATKYDNLLKLRSVFIY